MGKMYLLLTIFLVVGISGEGRGGETPHQAASRCFDGFTADCDRHCGMCHQTIGIEPPPTPRISDVYASVFLDDAHPDGEILDGDIILCLECHDDKVHPELHPVGIRYQAEFRETDFRVLPPKPPRAEYWEREVVLPPQGPKLFCDDRGGDCRIFCTTCHDPHLGGDKLLRPSPGPTICLSCHRK